jgi:hypothetical protein
LAFVAARPGRSASRKSAFAGGGRVVRVVMTVVTIKGFGDDEE